MTKKYVINRDKSFLSSNNLQIMARVRRICTECSCEELIEVKKHTDEEGEVNMIEYCCKRCGSPVEEYESRFAKKMGKDSSQD